MASQAAEKSASPERSRKQISSDNITVAPRSLYFPPPHNRSSANVLVITNLSTSVNCVFKLRTTNPSRYHVKPRMGCIAPKCITRVNITLQPMDVEDGAAIAAKDRFELIAKLVPAALGNSVQNIKTLWEKCGDDVELDVSVPCVFAMAPSPPSPASGAAAAAATAVAPPQPAVGSTRTTAAEPRTPTPSEVRQRGEAPATTGQRQPQQQKHEEATGVTVPSKAGTSSPVPPAPGPATTAAASGAAAAAAAAGSAGQLVDGARAQERQLRKTIATLQREEEAASGELESSRASTQRLEHRGQRLHTAAAELGSGAARPRGGVFLSVVIFWMIIAYVAGAALKHSGALEHTTLQQFFGASRQSGYFSWLAALEEWIFAAP